MLLSSIESLNSEYHKASELSIKGSVQEQAARLPARVRIFEKSSGRLVADIITDKNGNYEHKGLPPIRFFLVAHHPASQFNAVIQDNVVPK